MEKLQYRTL